MWSVPTWSNAVDCISTALQVADDRQKKLSNTYSLSGKRSKSDQLLENVISIVAEDNLPLVMLLNVYFNIIEVGLRELHTLPLTPRESDEVCRITFYSYWVMPLLESLNEKLEDGTPETLLLREIIALQRDYYAGGHTYSVDGYLNKRISALLPRGTCTAFKQQLHKNRNRRFFSMNDEQHRELLEELSLELARDKRSKPEVATRVQQLYLLFKSGAILRYVDKWLGSVTKQKIISSEQQQKIANKITQYTEFSQIEPHHFHSFFASELRDFWQLIGHEEVAPDADLCDPAQMSCEERDRLWPMLLQTEVDHQLLHCHGDYYIEEIHAYCVENAPEPYLPYLNHDEINDMNALAYMHLLNGVLSEDAEKLHHQIQQLAFLGIKKMLVAMHDERQLGYFGVDLASTLIARALSAGYRLTENELTPLLNILVENLPTDNSLFPLFDFSTPFRLRECGMPGTPLQDGQDIYKDDEAMIYGLALRLHNERIYHLDDNTTELIHLGYPFHKLDRLLEKLFACADNLAEIAPRSVARVFREEAVRRRPGGKGNPCWRFSDATPYFILRNLELHLKLTGLIRLGVVYLTPNIDHYYSMSNKDKRRVLKLLDPIAYRRDLKQWWAGKKAKHGSQRAFEVDGEYFLQLKVPPLMS